MSRGPQSTDAPSSAPERPEPDAPTPHWLTLVVERGGVVAAKPPAVPHTMPVRDAWPLVARAFAISEQRVAEMVAAYFRLRLADLGAVEPGVTDLVPPSVASEYLIHPLRSTNRELTVATCDPTDVERERALGFLTGRAIRLEVAPPSVLTEAVKASYAPPAERIDDILERLEADLGEESASPISVIESVEPEQISEDDAHATPVIRLTNVILRDAVALRASDIHIEPGAAEGLVRLRIDGVLRPHMALPMPVLNRIVSRLKVLSRLDIADRLRPQDGKARVLIRDRAYDLRVSTIPVRRSEKCVLRVLDSSASVTLEDLRVPTYELERLRELVASRDGIVVVTGPTGSGKTTTLYGALRELNNGKVNIMTVEDPVEYDLPSVTQTQVETRQGVTFGRALRALLRQDPDVILVGEIRDKETAEVATQAAMTGHLVLTTVHANDAVSAVGRLTDMGLRHSVISQTLRGALAQRLIRRVCQVCAKPAEGELTPDEARLAEQFGVRPVVRAVGCDQCSNTGYRGRLPVVEVLTVTPRFRDAIEQHKGWPTLSRIAAQSGMRSMKDVALEWMERGETTLSEVERVLGQKVKDEEAFEDEAQRGPSRVLLVHPEDVARSELVESLKKGGFDVSEAVDGSHALEVLAADPDFSLLLSALSMPNMDGRTLLDEVRGSSDVSALPVMVLSNGEPDGEARIEMELLEAGADECVPEAWDRDRIVARAKALVRRSLL